ncbi:MAG: AraC family transcriptional regulator [Clostridiaceae bacterium]|nr:AraC family transcriptional regulator [Clostridiaceae bacterium]
MNKEPFLKYELDISEDSIWLYPTFDNLIKHSMPFIQEVGDFLANQNYYTERQGLESFLIKYTIRGEGILKYNSDEYTVRPGQIFWIDNMNYQYYKTSENTGFWHVAWIHFYGISCKEMYNLFLEKNNNRNVISMNENNNIKDHIYKIINLYSNDNHSGLKMSKDIYVSNLLQSIMYEILMSTVESLDFQSIPSIIRSACDYITNNYEKNINLDSLAQRFNVDKFYFHKLFKQYTQTTPHQYLITTRLNAAKKLLKTTKATITEIALDVGFNNPSHFINFFRKSENVTPGAYRKLWIK